MSVENVAKTAKTFVGLMFGHKQSAERAHAWMVSQPEPRQTRILASSIGFLFGAAAAATTYAMIHGKVHGFMAPVPVCEGVAASVYGLMAVRPDLKGRIGKEAATAAYVAYRFAGTALRFTGLVVKTAFKTAAFVFGGALVGGLATGAAALAYEATRVSAAWGSAGLVAAAAGVGFVAYKFGEEAIKMYKGYPEWGTFKGDVKNFWNKTKTIAADVNKVRAWCDRPSQSVATQASNSEVLAP